MLENNSQADFERPSRVELSSNQLSTVFEQYGIEDIENLSQAVVSQMDHRGWSEFEPSTEFQVAIKRSLEDAFLEISGQIVIANAVSAAIEDAAYWLVNENNAYPGRSVENFAAPEVVSQSAKILPSYTSRGVDATGCLYFQDGSTSTGQR